MPAIGSPAPDFEAPGTDGTPDGRRTYTLSEYLGQPVVLAFYPGDNTPVCTRQLNSYTSEIEEFRQVGAQLLAISPQDVASHEAFAENQGGYMWSAAYFPVANAATFRDNSTAVALGGAMQPLTLDVTIGFELAKS